MTLSLKKYFIATACWFHRWLATTNHKDIGTLYLIFSGLMFFIGGMMAMVIRAQLYSPGMGMISGDFYNQMVTLHGLIMIFGVIMPASVGLANWMIPMLIGAPDMAMPRLNNWSFWLLPTAFTLLLSTLFISGPAPNAGWTFYAPLSSFYGPKSMDYMIFSIHLLGISSILGALNIITTIFNLRAPGMTLMKMPMFVWTWLVTGFLLLAVMPILAGTVTMLLFDRHFGTSFFNASGGGDPLLFEHLFWFFGHPEVYILVLPAFGVISEIIPTFSRKPLFGYRFMVYAVASIAFLSFMVWAHHMFPSGISLQAQIFFMYTTMLIAVPTGIKVFNWLATLFKGSISFETPMLFALGFICMFTFGGLTGIMLSIAPADFQYHDSYFVVAHFHYVLVAGVLFALFAAIYYWFPKITGRYISNTLGKLHFWLSLFSVNLLFFPMHFLGLAGMPRRIVDYNIQFTDFNQIASIGAFLFGASQLFLLIGIIHGRLYGQKASSQVWDGGTTLEWTLPSPAPYHSFHEPPVIT